MSATYAERARVALAAFLADATTGIDARCAAVNTDMGDSLLPEAWVFGLRRRGRTLDLPMVRIAWLGERHHTERTSVSQVYEDRFLLALVVGAEHTHGDPETEETIVMRLGRVLREIFQADKRIGAAWTGCTLGGRVCDALLDDLSSTPAVQLENLGVKRASLVSGIVHVRVEQDRTVT